MGELGRYSGMFGGVGLEWCGPITHCRLTDSLYVIKGQVPSHPASAELMKKSQWSPEHVGEQGRLWVVKGEPPSTPVDTL